MAAVHKLALQKQERTKGEPIWHDLIYMEVRESIARKIAQARGLHTPNNSQRCAPPKKGQNIFISATKIKLSSFDFSLSPPLALCSCPWKESNALQKP